MATYIVVPRVGLGSLIQGLAEEPSALATESAALTQRILSGTGLEGRPVLTAYGLISASGVVEATGPEAAKIAHKTGAVRALEGLDVILIDNPDAKTLAAVRDRADVFENIQIPIIEPVASEAEISCTPWHLSKINEKAARTQNLTGRGVLVGILDTGIDSQHPEFAGKSVNFGEFDSSGFLVSTKPRDAGDHGTHVAGLVGGKTCGVAPDADLAVAAVLTTKTPTGHAGFLAQILAGLNWLAHSNHGQAGAISQCAIINASLGSSGYNSYLYSSLHIIRQTPAAQMIAAIGNAGRKGVNYHGSPGNYDITLGIGATDSSDIVAAFSDWGIEPTHAALKPDLSAPGVDICSSVPGGKYARKSGTSMATPIVAGAAALLIQKYPKLARKPLNLFTRLLGLVDPAPRGYPQNQATGYNRVGAGRLDLTHI